MNATPYTHSDQKSFPDLRNMKEREEFLENYKDWPVWCRNELTEETFYRYDLPDGSAIVVRSYPYTISCPRTVNRDMVGQTYYLLEFGEKGHFEDCRVSMTELKEYLTLLRKKKR